MPAQHGKHPRQTGRCEEVLSPVAAPHPWRSAIAAAGLIERFLWDSLWDRPNNRVLETRVWTGDGRIVVNTPSTRSGEETGASRKNP